MSRLKNGNDDRMRECKEPCILSPVEKDTLTQMFLVFVENRRCAVLSVFFFSCHGHECGLRDARSVNLISLNRRNAFICSNPVHFTALQRLYKFGPGISVLMILLIVATVIRILGRYSHDELYGNWIFTDIVFFTGLLLSLLSVYTPIFLIKIYLRYTLQNTSTVALSADFIDALHTLRARVREEQIDYFHGIGGFVRRILVDLVVQESGVRRDQLVERLVRDKVDRLIEVSVDEFVEKRVRLRVDSAAKD
jgi:hypothetical protein